MWSLKREINIASRRTGRRESTEIYSAVQLVALGVKGQTERPVVIGSPEEGHNTHLASSLSMHFSFSLSHTTYTAGRP